VELLVRAGQKKWSPALPAGLTALIQQPQIPALEQLLASYLIDKSTVSLIDWRPNAATTAGAAAYFTAIPGEGVIAGIDFTANRTYAQGLLITNMGLHWLQPMSKPQQVYYHTIETLQLDSDWLNINGIDLDAGRLINYRLLLMCKHVRLLFR